MHDFKRGDYVQMGIPPEKFEREARNNSSTTRYIKHFVEGGIAKVVENNGRSIRTMYEGASESSNWFKCEWFEYVDKALNKIKQESQRI